MKAHPWVLSSIISAVFVSTASAALDGYWPVTETGGTTIDNVVIGGTDASLFNGATPFTDATRGQVLSFVGGGSYADAGTIPQLTLTNDYTWAFWAFNESDPVTQGTVTMLGNRYAPPGAPNEYAPREFTKFTPTAFEYHRDAAGENLNYPDFTIPVPGRTSVW